ncbi:MAG: hypothetical protein IKD04_08580 [Clostridia bacterium]|nr:hypothetical protein [Clostridia bacterium]
MENRIMNVMVRDLKMGQSEIVKVMGKGDRLKRGFYYGKTGEFFFNYSKNEYIEIMEWINDYLVGHGLQEKVFLDPTNYETSFNDFNYFFLDKSISCYMEEEEIRRKTTKKIDEKENIFPETIEFGAFYQSTADVKEPVEWIVLKKENNKMLLLSEKCLYCMSYNESSEWEQEWNKSDIKEWLNGFFYNCAFSNDDKMRIVEDTDVNANVFILSERDVKKYITDQKYDTKAKPTKYAIESGARVCGEGFAWWWLAWHTSNIFLPNVPIVGVSGSMGLRVGSNQNGICVRPAIWVKK